jgi:Pilin (bacterial filament)
MNLQRALYAVGLLSAFLAGMVAMSLLGPMRTPAPAASPAVVAVSPPVVAANVSATNASRAAVSQVAAGLAQLGMIKTAVAEYLMTNGKTPRSREDLGLGPDSGSDFVESIEVLEGLVLITYGRYADPAINGKTLAFGFGMPSDNSSVVWVCGRGTPPIGIQLLGSNPAARTTLPDSALPTNCRPLR